MKKYQKPEIEVVELKVDDVITTSMDLGDNESGFLPASIEPEQENVLN